MKPPGSVVTLTVNSWEGEGPEEGDFLRTSTGRCYKIEERHGKRLRCTVLEPDAVLSGEPGVWEWRWGKR